jgi:ribosome maturation factor RimP
LPYRKESEVAQQHGNERVRAVVEPPLSEKGFEVVDVERNGPVLKVTVDRAGGIDMEAVTEATRLVNDLLDRHDLVGDKTTLEVSSPGIERPLRTPEHFKRFVGTEVAVKAKAGTEGDRRLAGVLEVADDDGVVVAGRRLTYGDIDKARTVFVWPPPGRPAGKKTQAQKAKKIGRAS